MVTQTVLFTIAIITIYRLQESVIVSNQTSRTDKAVQFAVEDVLKEVISDHTNVMFHSHML